MKITRLRVAELRQFREPFELADLQPGLNIFSGANEAGKSTLVRAIRAAFFERHRSTSVDDLRPYGDTAATPAVELDFEIAGTDYRLSKSFLQKKRCELLIGSRRLEGVDAEDQLAQLLGFQFALKGASREEHWGVPGLLWIEQGGAQRVHDAVLNAADHLRSALDASLGEVAASGGDQLVAQVRKLRDELLTGTGKPRAAYQDAITAQQTLGEQAAALDASLATYRAQVDQLRGLRELHTADARAQPWAAYRDQQLQAQTALQAVDALASEASAERDKLRQAGGLRQLLVQVLTAAELQQTALAEREAALAAAIAQHSLATDAEHQQAQAEHAAAARLQTARDDLAAARLSGQRSDLTRQITDTQTRTAELAGLLERASAAHQRASELQREAALLAIAPADLKTLRKQQQRLTELDISQAAVATRLRYTLDVGAAVEIDGTALSGNGERLLVGPTTLLVAGVGRLEIAPGGNDLTRLALERYTLHDSQQTLLQRLGLASLADAELRERAHAGKLAEARLAEQAHQLLAPDGLDALRGHLDLAQARHAEACAAWARLPPVHYRPTPPLAGAEHENSAAGAAAEATSQTLQQARQALAAATSQRESARQERDSLSTTLAAPQRLVQLAAKRAELAEAGAHEAAATSAIAAIDARIAAARPALLKQDVERFGRSAQEAERRHQARDRLILQIETTLAAAGAQGLEEELAARQGELDQARRRHDELRRRAEALDFLLQRLDHHRQALTRRLQAPLQKHLDRILHMLFPAGQLAVDEQLVPGALSRPGPRGLQASDFDTLSFGAREQMGVISRLAYADLLKDAGRPTLLILDDALVHSDDDRLALMKRVLFDAAQRHQVLLFTCHPAHWRDMGVAQRSLDDERRRPSAQ